MISDLQLEDKKVTLNHLDDGDDDDDDDEEEEEEDPKYAGSFDHLTATFERHQIPCSSSLPSPLIAQDSSSSISIILVIVIIISNIIINIIDSSSPFLINHHHHCISHTVFP